MDARAFLAAKLAIGGVTGGTTPSIGLTGSSWPAKSGVPAPQDCARGSKATHTWGSSVLCCWILPAENWGPLWG